jgi:hypothetical protein
MVAFAVLVFRAGGVAALGVVTAVRMAAAALLGPGLATVADRVRPRAGAGRGRARPAATSGASRP